MQKNEVLESVVAQSMAQGETLKEGLVGHAALIHEGLAQLSASLIIAAVILAVAIVVHGLLIRRKG